jgi:hypothetical protein
MKVQRLRKFRCKSKRIRQLAQPKNVTGKYCGEEVKQGKPLVEIIRTFEEPTPVRIKMLAYPKVRKLVSSRDAYKEIVGKERDKRFENLISRSMLTMYSRLANVQLPEKACRKKWTRSDWQRHCEWLKSRALPKREIKEQLEERKKVPIDSLTTSIYKLSRPRYPRKKYRPIYGYRSLVKDGALKYDITERVRNLANPKRLADEDDKDEDYDPFQVRLNALRFNPSRYPSSNSLGTVSTFNFHSSRPHQKAREAKTTS